MRTELASCSVPSLPRLSLRTMMMSASGATPAKVPAARPLPAAMPATWVPWAPRSRWRTTLWGLALPRALLIWVSVYSTP